MEGELVVPETLDELSVGQVMRFKEVMGLKDLSDYKKVAKVVSAVLDVKTDGIPLNVLVSISNDIILLMSQEEPEDTANIDDLAITIIEGREYGLEPAFAKMETGAYIDAEDLMKEKEIELHKLMAILYRPIIDKGRGGYDISAYSTESSKSVDDRADLFYRMMPYTVVRSVVNFMQRLMVS